MFKKEKAPYIDPNWIKVDGHSFSKADVLKHKTEQSWLDYADDKHPKAEKEEEQIVTGHKEAWWPGDPERVNKLKTVYALATGKTAAPAAVAPPAVEETLTDKTKDKAQGGGK